MLLDNITEAVECMKQHINSYSNIHIVVDSDVDGYGSASMIYRYLKHIGNNKITYSLHTKKQHGLSSDIVIPDDCNLLIIPDAGSNDVEQCKTLKEKGIDIVIMDHHLCDIKNPYAIIVNNQMCNYPNKNLCGAGVVFKVLKALDDELWENYADELLDVNALCNISDVMDMREPETRRYVDIGLNKIRSKLFKALIEKQSYSMNNIVNITSVQFYITPILNAMIRVGNQDEKDLLFRAFIETDEVFKYKKRGELGEIDEDIYTRAARLCYNAKNRQSKEVQKEVKEIENIIINKHINDNKVLFINVTDILGESFTGLVAMKIAERYNKPCLLLRKQKLKDNGDIFFGGSCRNFDYSPIKSLKNFLNSTDKFEFVQGHDNAAGVSIRKENIIEAIKVCNEKLKEVDFTKIYYCDFDIEAESIDVSFVKAINDIKNLFGQGIKEPLAHITNIPVCFGDVLMMGRELNSWKIIVNDDMAYVKFLVDKDSDLIIKSYKNHIGNNSKDILGFMNIVGTLSLNNYKGILTPQVIIKDYDFYEV